jgi:hypothetical protein
MNDAVFRGFSLVRLLVHSHVSPEVIQQYRAYTLWIYTQSHFSGRAHPGSSTLGLVFKSWCSPSSDSESLTSSSYCIICVVFHQRIVLNDISYSKKRLYVFEGRKCADSIRQLENDLLRAFVNWKIRIVRIRTNHCNQHIQSDCLCLPEGNQHITVIVL